MKKKGANLGALVKEYRVKAGLTQMDLAEKLNYEIPQFISLMENGHSKIPLNVLGELITILRIPEKKAMDVLLDIYETEVRLAIGKGKQKAKAV